MALTETFVLEKSFTLFCLLFVIFVLFWDFGVCLSMQLLFSCKFFGLSLVMHF